MGNRCGNGHRRGWFRASLNAKSNVKGITIGGDKDNRRFSLFPTLFFFCLPKFIKPNVVTLIVWRFQQHAHFFLLIPIRYWSHLAGISQKIARQISWGNIDCRVPLSGVLLQWKIYWTYIITGNRNVLSTDTLATLPWHSCS